MKTRVLPRGMTRDEVLALPASTNIETAARVLGVATSTAYKWCADDIAPFVTFKIGRRVMVQTESLLDLLGIRRDAE